MTRTHGCGLPGGLLTRPGVGRQNLVEGRVRDVAMRLQSTADGLGNLREVDAAIDEGINGDFVGRIKNRWKCATDFASITGELE